jgi:hypothetical protein
MKHYYIARKKVYHPSDMKVSKAQSRVHLQLAIALRDPEIRSADGLQIGRRSSHFAFFLLTRFTRAHLGL